MSGSVNALLLQIAQRELQVLDTLGRGASSVVYLLVAARLPKQHLQYHSIIALVPQLRHITTTAFSLQVVKAYYLKGDKFVAVKRINVFEKVVFYSQHRAQDILRFC